MECREDPEQRTKDKLKAERHRLSRDRDKCTRHMDSTEYAGMKLLLVQVGWARDRARVRTSASECIGMVVDLPRPKAYLLGSCLFICNPL